MMHQDAGFEYSLEMIGVAFILIMGIGGGAMFGPQAAFVAELFKPRLRYSGFDFARKLGSILDGDPSPFIAALLVGSMLGTPEMTPAT